MSDVAAMSIAIADASVRRHCPGRHCRTKLRALRGPRVPCLTRLPHRSSHHPRAAHTIRNADNKVTDHGRAANASRRVSTSCIKVYGCTLLEVPWSLSSVLVHQTSPSAFLATASVPTTITFLPSSSRSVLPPSFQIPGEAMTHSLLLLHHVALTRHGEFTPLYDAPHSPEQA